MKLVRLNKIKSYRDQDDPFYEPAAGEREGTTPITINADSIKSYYARKEGRVGTRINFMHGNGIAVSELPQELGAVLLALGAQILGNHAPAPASSGTQN